MKVFTKVVVDIESSEVIYKEGYESSEEIALCKGGGGSAGGGGGQSGQVSYPPYMQNHHEAWLNGINQLVNEARYGGNPFTAYKAYVPTPEITDMGTAVSNFNVLVDALAHETDWEDAVGIVTAELDATVFDDTYIDADIAAFGDVIDDEITGKILPNFQTSLRDTNAVYSSTFVMGEAFIYGMRNRDIIKYGTGLRVNMNTQRNTMISQGVEKVLNNLMERIKLEQAHVHYNIEANRISIVAHKEEMDQNLVMDELDARWMFETSQYGANMLAAIGGGTVSPTDASMGKTQSALAGALSGASAGAMAGSVIPGVGTAIGAVAGGVIGGLGGYLS